MSSQVENLSLTSWVAPPVAAGFAMAFSFRFFQIKTLQQLGHTVPSTTFLETAAAGVMAAPKIGAIVGAQMLVQAPVERLFVCATPNSSQEPGFLAMIASSAVVAALSTPPFVVFNGQTMNKTAKESLKDLFANKKKGLQQTGAIVTRETLFLLSLRASGPVNDKMKDFFGSSKIVEVAATFMTGVIGSLAGHPADTLLTCLQGSRPEKPVPVPSLVTLVKMQGGLARCVGAGLFTSLYHLFNKAINS